MNELWIESECCVFIALHLHLIYIYIRVCAAGTNGYELCMNAIQIICLMLVVQYFILLLVAAVAT